MAPHSSARILFDSIMAAKGPSDNGLSPQQRLFDYLDSTLGSIERIHFDYKTKADSGTPRLGAEDKRNIARAVSGFANTEGGVLIWGVEDGTLRPRPVADARTFTQALLDFSKAATVPTVVGLDADFIPADETGSGFVALYIPESDLRPHRVIVNCKEGNANTTGETISDLRIKDHYFFRTADSFHVATHVHLEYLFNRRPTPRLEITTRPKLWSYDSENIDLIILVGIENTGRGAAQGPFVAALVHPPNKIYEFGIDGNGNYGLPRNKGLGGEYEEVLFGLSSDPIIPSGVNRDIFAVLAKIRRGAPLDTYYRDIVIDMRVAAENYPVEHKQVTIGGSALVRFAAEIVDSLT